MEALLGPLVGLDSLKESGVEAGAGEGEKDRGNKEFNKDESFFRVHRRGASGKKVSRSRDSFPSFQERRVFEWLIS